MGGLSSLLVQDQVLSVTQIEQTLQRQVILGGDLPTILLELRMLDEQVLVTYMSKVVKLPPLPFDTYDQMNRSLAGVISESTAVACKAVPVQVGEHLLVASTGTLTPDAVQKLCAESGLPVTVQLVLEFRFALMMNQVYGIPLIGRMATLQKKLLPDFQCVQPEPGKHAFERPGLKPVSTVQIENEVDENISGTVSIESTSKGHEDHTSKLYRQKQPVPVQTLSPEKRPATPQESPVEETPLSPVAEVQQTPPSEPPSRISSPVRMDDIAARIRLTAPPEPLPDMLSAAVEQGGAASESPLPVKDHDLASPLSEAPVIVKSSKRRLLSFSEAAAELENAENRDEIMETFFHFAHQAFDFTFLSVVHGDDASGRVAAYRGGEFNDADFVSVPLNEGGLFGKAFETATYQLGAMDDRVGLNALNQLGLDVPLNAAVIPVVLKRRVIMLLYGDSGHHGIRAKRVERIAEFTKLVSAAFERLLLARKYRKFSSVPPPPPSAEDGDSQPVIKVNLKQVARPKRDLSAFGAVEAPEVTEPKQPEATEVAVGLDVESMAESISVFESEPPPDPSPEPSLESATAVAVEDVASSLEEALRAGAKSLSETKLVDSSARIAPAASPAAEVVTKGAKHGAFDKVTVQAPNVAAFLAEMSGADSAPADVAWESPSKVDYAPDEGEPVAIELTATPSPPEEAAKVSISPSVRVHRVKEAENTLRIHVEPEARTEYSEKPVERAPVRRPPVMMMEPIRVSRAPAAAAFSSKLPEKKDTAAVVDPKATVPERPSLTNMGRSPDTSPYHRLGDEAPDEESGSSDERSISYIPDNPQADGRYIQVDREYVRSEKKRSKNTANQFAISKESLRASAEGIELLHDETVIPLSQLDPRRTAGYTDLSRPGDIPPERVEQMVMTPLDPGTEKPVANFERLVEALIANQTSTEGFEQILAGGDDAIGALVAHFPGPLNCDRFQEMGKLSKVADHGPVLAALWAFGPRVSPHVVGLLESFDSEIRFYATFLLVELGQRDVLSQLAKRVFDNDRQIRALALDGIAAHGGTAEYLFAIEYISMLLVGSTTPLEKKRIAAESLGQLADPASIQALIAMLGSVDGLLSERCQKALIRITFQDFGFSERRWTSWHVENKYVHRIEWAIEALTDKNEEIRRTAVNALRQTLGNRIDWPKPPYDFNQRRELQSLIRAWWDGGGRDLFPITLQ